MNIRTIEFIFKPSNSSFDNDNKRILDKIIFTDLVPITGNYGMDETFNTYLYFKDNWIKLYQ